MQGTHHQTAHAQQSARGNDRGAQAAAMQASALTAAPGARAAAWARPRPLARRGPPRLAPAAAPATPRPAPHTTPRGPAPPCAQLNRSGSMGPLRDFQRELGMQSNRLNPDIRERVEGAIEALGYRATVGDVAARAGVKVSEADEALKALAYDALGHLEVRAHRGVVQPAGVFISAGMAGAGGAGCTPAAQTQRASALVTRPPPLFCSVVWHTSHVFQPNSKHKPQTPTPNRKP